jgi:DNA-directed RNA polymerase sigma subunit (sigma70/sigma32)
VRRRLAFSDGWEAAGMREAEALALDQASRVLTSLDRRVGDGDTTLGELQPPEGPDIGEELVLSLRRDAIRRAVGELPEPEREVVRPRFGIDGDPEPQTQASLGRRLGLTRAEVQAMEQRALSGLSRLRELEALAHTLPDAA